MEPVYRVQVISQLIPNTGNLCKDLEKVLPHYDLSCCSFATDGKNVYATFAAMESTYLTRLVKIDWFKLTSISRLVKYHMRGYDFEIVGPDGDVMPVDVNSEAMVNLARKLKRAVGLEGDFEKEIPCERFLGNDEEDEPCSNAHLRNDRVNVKSDQKDSMLTLSMIKYETGDANFLPSGLCGYAPEEIDSLLYKGEHSQNHIVDWQCLMMNSFCDDLLMRDNPLSDDEVDAATMIFSKRLDRFVCEVENHQKYNDGNALLLFHGGIDREWMSPNVNFDEFRRSWCESISPLKKFSSSSISPLPPIVPLVVCNPHIAQSGGIIYSVGYFADGQFNRFEITSPEMNFLGVWQQQGSGLTYQLMCDGGGSEWENDPQIMSFHGQVKSLDALWIDHVSKCLPQHDGPLDIHSTLKENYQPNFSKYEREHARYPPTLSLRWSPTVDPLWYTSSGDRTVFLFQSIDGSITRIDPKFHGRWNVTSYTIRIRMRLDWIYCKCEFSLRASSIGSSLRLGLGKHLGEEDGDVCKMHVMPHWTLLQALVREKIVIDVNQKK
jgi:hypothetical protein